MIDVKVRLQHDSGLVRIATSARSVGAAVETVCSSEGAPRRAVVSVLVLRRGRWRLSQRWCR